MAGMAPLSLRRARQNRAIRDLTRQVRVDSRQLIQPLFVVDGITSLQAVPGLDQVHRETPDSLLAQIESDLEAGIDKFLLFGVPLTKSAEAFDYSFTNRQISAVKRRFGDAAWLAVDVCLCSYTSHGHCGILNEAGDHLINDATIEQLAAAALEFAQAGADCVAPSDMMDGRVAAIRNALTSTGLDRTLIMSYAAKFHSTFYGPFRTAAESAPAQTSRLTDRSTYQIDPARPNDALLAAQRDRDEGADILMVKPGLPYLDVLAGLSARIPYPWAVYQVSGEQASIDLLAAQGLLDRDFAQREAWTAFLRAGATMIISYAARRAKHVLQS
jgi:porphobilinogen synthase